MSSFTKMPGKRILTAEKTKVPLLQILKKLKPKEREYLINELNEEAIDKISESIFNLLHNKELVLSKPLVRKLKRTFKERALTVRYIADDNNPWKKRQKKITQLGSGKITLLKKIIS